MCATPAWTDNATETTPEAHVVPESGLGRLPVKEVTVFKDGHAFVLHEGDMPTGEDGNVVMDYLPAPVIGTFWPYSSDPAVKLRGVVAGRTKVATERPALDLRELLAANIGAEILVTESNRQYSARILSIPTLDSGEPTTGDTGRCIPAPPRAESVLLETPTGVKILPLDRLQDVTFLDEPRRTLARTEFRDLLTLRLDWNGRSPNERAAVGLVYLQKGIRWIPSYRIAIDGEGIATVEFQATLLNELVDLHDVTMHLVIGVPTFAFQETIDPISLQRAAAQLSPYFQTGAQTAYAFSNAIMTQHARAGEHLGSAPPNWPAEAPPALDLGPDLPGAGRSEDLFLFTVEHITLKKGERMVIPIRTFTLAYEDVYKLDLPFSPPPEVRRTFNNQQQADLARLFAAPKVVHVLRLQNDSGYPLTTAPAMILQQDRLLAQGMMTYTAVGGSTDLEVTAAVDVQVVKSEVETGRDHSALKCLGYEYDRVNLSGAIGLGNYRGHSVNLEIVRHVLGSPDTADHDGMIRMVNVHEEGWYLTGGGEPHWWNWFSWPNWWYHCNGMGRIEWQVTLEAGERIELGYTWHYYWR